MKRLVWTWLAACTLWLGGAAAGMTQAENADAAPETAPSAEAGLEAVVTDGLALLEAHRLKPDPETARAALLEALIRSAAPSAEFLDEDELAARTRRMTEREWDTGLALVAVADGLPKVAAVRADSPADIAGIQPGELIERVGGHEILSDTPLKLVREWLSGGESAELDVMIRGEDGASRTDSLERVRRDGPAVEDKEDLPAGIGYTRMEGLFPGAGTETAAALREWNEAGMIGAVLDLRGAGGSAWEEIGDIAVWFSPDPDGLFAMTDRGGNPELSEQAALENPDMKVDMPLMVLVDEGTTGAAELLAAVLAGSTKGTMLIGRETAGDPMIREPVALPTGGYALLPTRQVRTADGTVYAGVDGVQPDVLITDAALNETVYEPEEPILSRKKNGPTEEDLEDKALRERTRNDTYLRRATDMLLGLQALGYGQ